MTPSRLFHIPSRLFHASAATSLLAMVFAGTAAAQGPPDAVARLAAQREAMQPLERMDGVWRGTAWTLLPSGQRHELIQTERVGPFLDGTVRIVEGRGYEPDGTISFNALAVISYSPAEGHYTMRSYAMGYVGNFVFTPTADGFVWELPAGPATIRYTAVIRDGVWREIGERLVPGQEPVRIAELNLSRISDTDWPAAGAVELR